MNTKMKFIFLLFGIIVGFIALTFKADASSFIYYVPESYADWDDISETNGLLWFSYDAGGPHYTTSAIYTAPLEDDVLISSAKLYFYIDSFTYSGGCGDYTGEIDVVFTNGGDHILIDQIQYNSSGWYSVDISKNLFDNISKTAYTNFSLVVPSSAPFFCDVDGYARSYDYNLQAGYWGHYLEIETYNLSDTSVIGSIQGNNKIIDMSSLFWSLGIIIVGLIQVL